MANSLAKERNKAEKGRTGMLTRKKRKQLNKKSRPWGKGTTPPGHFSSPTDPRSSVKKTKKDRT
jgi:hypothetical protein